MTGSSERGREYDDYAPHIEHSGTFYTLFDLLTSLDPAILKQLDEATRERFARKQMGPPIHVRIPVKGGQVVGRVGGRSLDISVINTEVTLKGFLSPKLYGHYAWRVHVVDPFEYFDEPRVERKRTPPPKPVDIADRRDDHRMFRPARGFFSTTGGSLFEARGGPRFAERRQTAS